jgi:hypothetical protein
LGATIATDNTGATALDTTTDLYLFRGCGQPAGIVALLTVHITPSKEMALTSPLEVARNVHARVSRQWSPNGTSG